ncbi:glycoside hydrolase family 57 protein [Halothiobacillus sp.]|uniref:glycoside hydrolase family 57 protein n=1 Tax=Halothiobacillus sp. TaxID=1891311 RepID=UPI002AD59FFC|nr:glycoside hydrolase family 57 protein [Halothiobacillus sp.]
MKRKKLPVVLCWHMHQPEYRDPRDKVYQQPWTYLHAIKDYVDMVAHLERYPDARAVVNFVPILLEQLDDYAKQVDAYAVSQKIEQVRDPLLQSLVQPSALTDPASRMHVVRALMRANESRLIRRFEPFNDLIDLARSISATTTDGRYLSDAFIGDLSVWYHLAWMGETVRQNNPLVQQLMIKATNFDDQDRLQLFLLIGSLISGIFPRYRALAEQGRVELSMTPYAHPIMPLLLDMEAGKQACPHDPQPQHVSYPDGPERVQWHLSHGLDVFQRYFGIRPSGCWPSEGAISEPTVQALAHAGFSWLASGDQVLANSRARIGHVDNTCRHHVWQFDHLSPAIFFRDDGLSDLIGFDYQNWHADDAVTNFISHLESIHTTCDSEDAVVSIILDGENAWEFYPDNGFWFLDTLYKRLSNHPTLELTTFSKVVEQSLKRRSLKHLVAGSWVHGNLATWVGSPAKNRAWDMLIDARIAFKKACEAGRWDSETLAANLQQLAICEGSDWFWWFGDYNPGDAVRDFDQLYRLQLSRLYELIGQSAPHNLSEPLCIGAHESDATVEAGGVMRRGQ